MKSRNKSRVMSTVALVATFVMAGAGCGNCRRIIVRVFRQRIARFLRCGSG